MPEVCRSCKAPLHWAITTSGKRMPLDVEEVEAPGWRPGLFAVTDDVAVCWKKSGPRPDGPLYQSHYASCAQADAWRGGGS